MSAALATVPSKPLSLVEKFASKFLIDQDKLLTTLKATAFKQRGDVQVTNEQMTALLIVADQYGLNPFTKEIFAYPDKQNGIVPVVSVDGWARIINEHGALDGIDFRYSAEPMVTMGGAKPCPAWCEVIITRKDRAKPIIVREYLDEVFRVLDYATPWKTHTKRMLRHKTLIQGARIAFGFAGIYDEDEAERILDAHAVDGEVTGKTVQVEQPRARIESVTPASASTSAAASSAEPAVANSASGGGSPDRKDAPPMKPSQVNILKAKLAHAALTETDLEVAFAGKSLEPKAGKDLFSFDDFGPVQDWISKNSKA